MKKRFAIYGKGGIGKTTVAVNMALTLAQQGHKVMLIGCDPKQDTTRLLTSSPLPSIMEKYDDLQRRRIAYETVVAQPNDGLYCCEVGGPKPGVGCAGRGITIALDYLNDIGLLEGMDIVIYDVLGDVVCGGFSSPITRGYAKEVYIVTSGEQASLFAANNIIKGMMAIHANIGGIIYNERKFSNEDKIIDTFSTAVSVPVIGKISYSERIKFGEIRRHAICEYDNSEAESRQFKLLCNKIMDNNIELSPSCLDVEELYELVRNQTLGIEE